MWHHQSVIALFRIVLQLLTDLMALTALAFRQRRATAAEIMSQPFPTHPPEPPDRIIADHTGALALLSDAFYGRRPPTP